MANPLAKAAVLTRRSNPSGGKSFSPGDLVPSWSLGKPRWSDWSTERAVREGYKSSHLVYAAVQKVAQAASSVPWVAVVGGEDDPEHPLSRLLENPNPAVTRATFVQEVVAHLYLGGNSLVAVNGGLTSFELWAVSPEGWRPVPSPRGLVDRYERGSGKNKTVLRASEAVHLKFPDPGDPYWGMAPLRAAAMGVDTDVEAIRWNKVALQNRAVADGAMVVPGALTDEQYERMRSQMRSQHQGPASAREPFLLEGGVDWKQMSLSPAEMDFVESRKTTRQDVLSVFGVPSGMLGYVEKATLSDVHAMRLSFWMDTVLPLLSDMGASFGAALGPLYGGDVRVRPDVRNVSALAPLYQQKVETAARMVKDMGVPVEVASEVLELGIPAYDGWDRPVAARPDVPLTPGNPSTTSLAAAILGETNASPNGNGR